MTFAIPILGIGLVTPLGRNVRQHLALVGAETSLGRSARYRRRDHDDEELLACEWLSPTWRRTERIAQLALIAAREALAGHTQAVTDTSTTSARVRLIVHAALPAQGSEQIAKRIGGALKLPVEVHRGGGALTDVLRAAEEEEGPVLILAADSWLDPDRLAGRPPRSPWEPAAWPPSEGAAALWVAPATDSARPLGHVLHADACTGPARTERIADGAPLTQLMQRLPALQTPIAALWGRTAGDFDRSLSVPFATGRAAAAGIALAPDIHSHSLAHETGDLGAAEMTAELVFSLVAALAARSTAPLLTWGVQDDGRWSCCLVSAANTPEWEPPDTAAPEPAVGEVPVIHCATRFSDRSAAGAFEAAALSELLDSATFRASDRDRLPLREQPTVERRLDKAIAAARSVIGEAPLADMLARLEALRQDTTRPQPALAFAAAALLAHDADALEQLLEGALDQAPINAVAEGLAWAGFPVDSPRRMRPSGALRTTLLEHASLRAIGDATHEAAMAAWLCEHPPELQSGSPLHPAACFRAAARLHQAPWPLDSVRPWLDHDDDRVCAEAARLLRLSGDPHVARRLRETATIKKLGASALGLAALQDPPIEEAWFEQLIAEIPISEESLLAIGRAGLARSHAYLAHFLLDGRLHGAALTALCTLFGEPPELADEPAAWREHIAQLNLDPSLRYRRGKPWSLAAVIDELRGGKLSRNALRHRLDELRISGATGIAAGSRSVRVWASHASLSTQLQDLTTAFFA